MRLLFEQFDKDNDGKITKTELNFVMKNLFPDEVITEKDIDVIYFTRSSYLCARRRLFKLHHLMYLKKIFIMKLIVIKKLK